MNKENYAGEEKGMCDKLSITLIVARTIKPVKILNLARYLSKGAAASVTGCD